MVSADVLLPPPQAVGSGVAKAVPERGRTCDADRKRLQIIENAYISVMRKNVVMPVAEAL